MVEKVGHSKRMQVTRKAWLDDTKVNRRGVSPEPQADRTRGETIRESSIFADLGREKAPGNTETPNDDELDTLMTEAGANQTAAEQQTVPSGEEPDDDELDALLAESAPVRTVPAAAQATTRHGPFEQDSDDEDELEALMAEQADSTHSTKATVDAPATSNDSNNDFADEEEVMASMGW